MLQVDSQNSLGQKNGKYARLLLRFSRFTLFLFISEQIDGVDSDQNTCSNERTEGTRILGVLSIKKIASPLRN